MDSLPFPGIAVGVVRGDSLVYAQGFGVADRDSEEPVTAETMFQIGSTTKSFTATMLAHLIEQGRISLDDPLSEHLPPEVAAPSAENGDVIRIRHLASHTSGLPRQPPTLRRLHGDYPVLAFTHFELYQSIDESELEYVPGSGFSYSNFGYSVLGHVLERVSGLPYETLLSDELFGPLEMSSSTVTIWPRYTSRLAKPYYPRSDGTLVDYLPWDLEAMAPAGGIASSISDLAKYMVYQFDAAGAVSALREPVAELSNRFGYGFGLLRSSTTWER